MELHVAVHTYLHNWVDSVRSKLLHWSVGGLDLERRYSSRRDIAFNKIAKAGLFTLLAAKIRRSRGFYDFYTLWLFRKLWLQCEPSKDQGESIEKNHWQNMQGQWQEQFIQYIKQQTKIVVIGNSSELAHQRLGQHIDRQSCVVRFNHCFGQTAVGRKLDVWIQSPSYQGPKPESYHFRLISGPAVEYQLSPKTT